MITLNEAQQRIESTLNGRYDKDELRSIMRELLTEATGLSRSALLLADKDTLLSTEASQALSRYLDRMKTGMPLQYAVGHAPFFGYEFAVNPSVLIPRPETEELVELILRKERPAAAPLCLLDVGTGSGCLAITLARELRAKVWAMDISPDALATARTNVGEDDRIFFFEGDILSPDNRWDVLPPWTLSSAILRTSCLRKVPIWRIMCWDMNRPWLSLRPRRILSFSTKPLPTFPAAVNYAPADGFMWS